MVRLYEKIAKKATCEEKKRSFTKIIQKLRKQLENDFTQSCFCQTYGDPNLIGANHFHLRYNALEKL